MKQALSIILLVDDNRADNYLNELIIEQEGIDAEILMASNGAKAVELLQERQREGAPPPELIFLDLNMPKLNGWEFLDFYETFHKKTGQTSAIVLLTTSMNPEDEEHAKTIPLVTKFLQKPLTSEAMQDILQTMQADT